MRLPNMTDEEYIEFLEKALWEIDRRLREDIHPLVEFINRYINDDADRSRVANAYKWGVYGSAIHAQIALGQEGLDKYKPKDTDEDEQ
jgi:hypothetical protein